MLETLIQKCCHAAKHWVLDRAHPVPERIVVFPGRAGTVHAHMLRSLIADTRLCATVVEEHMYDATEERPTLWIEDEESVSHPMAVARYVGRLWRLYPVTPHHALLVDATLDLLSDFLLVLARVDKKTPSLVTFFHAFDVRKHVVAGIEALETRLEDDAFLDGFVHPTLSDVLWSSVMDYVIEHHQLFDLEFERFPKFAKWYAALVVEEVESHDVGTTTEEKKEA